MGELMEVHRQARFIADGAGYVGPKAIALAVCHVMQMPSSMLRKVEGKGGKPPTYITNAREMYAFIGLHVFGLSQADLGRGIEIDRTTIPTAAERFRHKLKRLQVPPGQFLHVVRMLADKYSRVHQDENARFGCKLIHNRETGKWRLEGADA